MIVFTFERNHPPGWISCGCTETSGAAVNADTCLCMYETRTRPWKSGWRSGKVDISSQSRETLTLDSLPQGDWNRGKKVMLHTLFSTAAALLVCARFSFWFTWWRLNQKKKKTSSLDNDSVSIRFDKPAQLIWNGNRQNALMWRRALVSDGMKPFRSNRVPPFLWGFKEFNTAAPLAWVIRMIFYKLISRLTKGHRNMKNIIFAVEYLTFSGSFIFFAPPNGRRLPQPTDANGLCSLPPHTFKP